MQWRRFHLGRVPAWLVMAGGAIAALALAQWGTTDCFLYNKSSSMPVGLYQRVRAPITRGAVVTVRAAAVAPVEAARNGFTDQGDRFLKRTVAVEGDIVCAVDDRITVNHQDVATRRATDSSGRRLPSWTGCRRLGAHDVLLLGETPDSFDGRYWGVVQDAVIDGVWRRVSW